MAAATTASQPVSKSIGKRGVDHLRVTDCPATPSLPSGNMNAPAMALGWLAADIIGAGDG
ncbi:GMC oxidoreductase [Sphingobium sp. TB-6]|uniref:GMC oxidoreductase n=1 Tax=Sphingobium sp. TB-6 TaxID=2728850 RepID=UPI003211D790